MQVTLPVSGDATLGTGHGLIERVMRRRCQGWAFEILSGRVVEEPVLAGLITMNYRMPGFGYVAAGVLGW